MYGDDVNTAAISWMMVAMALYLLSVGPVVRNDNNDDNNNNNNNSNHSNSIFTTAFSSTQKTARALPGRAQRTRASKQARAHAPWWQWWRRRWWWWW